MSLAALLELVDAAPPDYRLVWALAAYSGLRRGEIRGLRVSDVDTEENANVIYVRRSWDDGSGEVVAPKSRLGVRTVPIAPQLRGLILEHLARSGRRADDLIVRRTASAAFTPPCLEGDEGGVGSRERQAG